MWMDGWTDHPDQLCNAIDMKTYFFFLVDRTDIYVVRVVRLVDGGPIFLKY